MNDALRQSIEAAERYVAGMALRGGPVLDAVAARVRPEDFINFGPRLILTECLTLREQKTLVSPMAVLLSLQQSGRVKDLGENTNAAAYLSELMLYAKSEQDLEYMAAHVRNSADLREIARIATVLDRDANDSSDAAVELADRAAKELLDLVARRTISKPVGPREIIRESLEQWDLVWSGKPPTIPTGFDRLDTYIGGAALRQVLTIAARPGRGKTVILTQIALNVARRGVPVLLVSLEMTRTDVMDRIVSSEARVSLPRLRGSVKPDEDDVRRVLELTESEQLRDIPFAIDDRRGRMASEIITTIRADVRERGTKIVLIDYLGLIRPEKWQRSEPRTYQIGASLRMLRDCAGELGIALVTAAQIGREAERQGDEAEPKLHHLKDSGEIEQDCDSVILLHTLDKSPDLPIHRVNAIIAKNRYGPLDSVALEFERKYVRFYERPPV